MLINKGNFGAGDVVAFKLVNGDEIVAKVVEVTMLDYVISRPQTVVPSAKGMGLMQSLFTAQTNQDVHLSKSHVMMAAEVVKEMKDHYFKTTTGIETAPAGMIV